MDRKKEKLKTNKRTSTSNKNHETGSVASSTVSQISRSSGKFGRKLSKSITSPVKQLFRRSKDSKEASEQSTSKEPVSVGQISTQTDPVVVIEKRETLESVVSGTTCDYSGINSIKGKKLDKNFNIKGMIFPKQVNNLKNEAKSIDPDSLGSTLDHSQDSVFNINVNEEIIANKKTMKVSPLATPVALMEKTSQISSDSSDSLPPVTREGTSASSHNIFSSDHDLHKTIAKKQAPNLPNIDETKK